MGSDWWFNYVWLTSKACPVKNLTTGAAAEVGAAVDAGAGVGAWVYAFKCQKLKQNVGIKRDRIFAFFIENPFFYLLL